LDLRRDARFFTSVFNFHLFLSLDVVKRDE
jgi:hypothetical protein